MRASLGTGYLPLPPFLSLPTNRYVVIATRVNVRSAEISSFRGERMTNEEEKRGAGKFAKEREDEWTRERASEKRSLQFNTGTTMRKHRRRPQVRCEFNIGAGFQWQKCRGISRLKCIVILSSVVISVMQRHVNYARIHNGTLSHRDVIRDTGARNIRKS